MNAKELMQYLTIMESSLNVMGAELEDVDVCISECADGKESFADATTLLTTHGDRIVLFLVYE